MCINSDLTINAKGRAQTNLFLYIICTEWPHQGNVFMKNSCNTKLTFRPAHSLRIVNNMNKIEQETHVNNRNFMWTLDSMWHILFENKIKDLN